MIYVRWIESLQELRLYKDNGEYWPISVRNWPSDDIESLKKFLSIGNK